MTTATVPATTTSPATNAVLVLSTYNAANKPMVIDLDGKLLQIISVSSIKNSNCNLKVISTTISISIRNFRIWRWSNCSLWLWSDFDGPVLVFWWSWLEQSSSKSFNSFEWKKILISGQQDCWMQACPSKRYEFWFLYGGLQFVHPANAKSIAMLWPKSLHWLSYVSESSHIEISRNPAENYVALKIRWSRFWNCWIISILTSGNLWAWKL